MWTGGRTNRDSLVVHFYLCTQIYKNALEIVINRRKSPLNFLENTGSSVCFQEEEKEWYSIFLKKVQFLQ